MASLLSLLALAALTTPLDAAPSANVGSEPPPRISTLLVFGNDPCPKSSGDEIVVCARQPENERYRIPKRLRGKPYSAAANGSWAGTAKVLESVSRQGLPDSCNATGSNGQSGCFAKFLEDNRR